jgi:hypothetical protein
MGGDAPKNRKQEYKKQQKREGGDGGRDEKKRTGDGKPVTVCALPAAPTCTLGWCLPPH